MLNQARNENASSAFSQLLDVLGEARSSLVPAMRELEQRALHANGVPREAQLQMVKASRTVLKPLLVAFRGLLEPIAATDTKLSAVERQLER